MAQLRWLLLGLYFRYELTSMMRYRLLRKAALLISTICAGSAFARDSPPADLDNYVARVVKTFGRKWRDPDRSCLASRLR